MKKTYISVSGSEDFSIAEKVVNQIIASLCKANLVFEPVLLDRSESQRTFASQKKAELKSSSTKCFDIGLTNLRDSLGRYNEAFSSCLCKFYSMAQKEIIIFSPDFSDEVFTESVTDVLAAKVEEGVSLKIIVKNSKNFGADNMSDTFNGLVEKLIARGLYTDDCGIGENHELIVNSGAPKRASDLFESCNSAFSIIDNMHYRYRDVSRVSEDKNDYGVFVFFASEEPFARKFIDIIRNDLFPRFLKIVRRAQSKRRMMIRAA